VAQQWFYKLADGRDSGPLSSSALKRLADSGQINPSTPVKQAAGERWVPAARVTGLFPLAPSPSAPVVPPPLPQVAQVDAPAAPVPSPMRGDVRRLAGISILGWMVISVIGTIAIVSMALVILFLNRGDKAPSQETVVVDKATAEHPKPTADATKPPPATTAKNDQLPSEKPSESLIASEPAKPAPRTTEEILAAVEPAVVTIHVTKTQGKGTGSGFLIDGDGTIVTNYHVIEGAKSANVVFRDGTSAEVSGFLGLSPGNDLALLHAASGVTQVRPLVLAKAPPGKTESVFTFGAPIGLSGTVSTGIVSGLRTGREFQPPIKTVYDALGFAPEATWIQTTAPISHGNSGGPLVNSSGEVVGVNTWTCPIDNAQNLNFAISASHVLMLLGSEHLQLHALSELPPRRVDERLAAAEARKRQAAERAQALAEAKKAEAKQSELASLSERIAVAKEEYQQIEQEAIVAAAKRGDAFTQAMAAEAVAGKAAAQITDLQTRIDQLTADLNARSSSEISRRDQMVRRAQAVTQQAALKEQYGSLEAKYKDLDTSARDLKTQLDSLQAKKASRSLELRRMQIQYDLLAHGPSPEAAKDEATASAWRGIKKGMKTAEVQTLLGKPSKTESQARNPDVGPAAGRGGIVWQYKYQEAGTTVGIVGTIRFITGKVVDWEVPPWACVN
jgi:S1-C subfamily serine protease